MIEQAPRLQADLAAAHRVPKQGIDTLAPPIDATARDFDHRVIRKCVHHLVSKLLVDVIAVCASELIDRFDVVQSRDPRFESAQTR